MDWDSPTTKKHIAEAQAQGCELLGAGKDRNYRKYRLPCGHIEMKRINAMRDGNIRCGTCIETKHRKEASRQNCILIGNGKSNAYRLYKLPCGHKREVTIQHMRQGTFRCETCFEENLRADAAEYGCELIGPGSKGRYHVYRLPCGHKQEIKINHMRRGVFACQICQKNKFIEEAEVFGCTFLGAGEKRLCYLYRLPCGHTQEVQAANMRNGNFKCQECFNSELQSAAEAQGCEVLGPVSDGQTKDRRKYLLPCGHEQDIATKHMRIGNFRCQTCEDYSYTQPSQVYLLYIKVNFEAWLKLGYAKNIDFRASNYGLPSEAEVTVLATLPFSTGIEAVKHEKSLHQKYRENRLPSEEMLNFHTGSGATECYPVTMLETLLAEFKK